MHMSENTVFTNLYSVCCSLFTVAFARQFDFYHSEVKFSKITSICSLFSLPALGLMAIFVTRQKPHSISQSLPSMELEMVTTLTQNRS